MSDFGLDESFCKAAAKIKEHYGFEVPVSSLRNHCIGNATRIARQGMELGASGNALAAKGVQRLVAQADGSMVAMVRFDGKQCDQRRNRKVDYHEVRLCACRAEGSAQTIYRAAIAQPDEIGRLWNECAKQAGRGIDTFVHVVGDGATWIDQQARRQLQCNRSLVDFFHVCEYLKGAELPCAGNKHWFATQKNRLLRNRSDLVLQALGDHLESKSVPDQEAPVRCAHRYLNNRLHCLDYKGSLLDNLPIGSGLIESGHKHVVQARMKIAGAAWLPATADAFIQVRAHRASLLWDCFWKN